MPHLSQGSPICNPPCLLPAYLPEAHSLTNLSPCHLPKHPATGLSTQPLACLLGANKALTTTLLDVFVSVLVVAGGQNDHASFPH